MTNSKSTKRALILSCLSLLLCVSMLVGSTFAWFTDTTSTSVNTIEAGTLDIAFQMKEGENWVDAEGKVLDFTKSSSAPADEKILWEPGATYDLPAVRLINKGNLALKFKLLVNGISGDMELANVLEVIMNGNAMTKADGTTPVTLADLIADADGAAYGYLLPSNTSTEYTISLHMAEEAGNQYQGKKISGLTLTAYAAQYTHEYDSDDNQYDKDAEYAIAPPAGMAELPASEITGISVNVNGQGAQTKNLNAGFTFTAMETADEADTSQYASWNADFVVTADKDVAANAMGLAGNYGTYGWISLESAQAIPVGTDIRLLSTLMNGTAMTYAEVCEYASTFKCGVYTNDATATSGTTITVQLRLYETVNNVETGNYIVCGTYTYTF